MDSKIWIKIIKSDIYTFLKWDSQLGVPLEKSVYVCGIVWQKLG